MRLRADLREDKVMEVEQRMNMKDRLKELEKNVKKAERVIDASKQHARISAEVRHALDHLAEEHSNTIRIRDDIFQADSVIQHVLTKKEVDFAIGSDADFSVIAGDACLQMTAFKIDRSTKGELKVDAIVSNLDPVLSCRESAIVLARTAHSRPPTHPYSMEFTSDVRVKCLVAVLLGNYTFSVFHNIGPAAVRDMIHRLRKDSSKDLAFDNSLEEAYRTVSAKQNDPTKFTQLPRSVLIALVDAMAYEPVGVDEFGSTKYLASERAC